MRALTTRPSLPLLLPLLLLGAGVFAGAGCEGEVASEGEGEGDAGEGEGDAGEGEGECAVGTVGCGCDAGSCGVDLVCNDDGVCEACPFGVDGCPCLSDAAGDSCLGGDVCDATTNVCRPATTCETLGCVEHQQCDAPVGEDAVCLAACDEGYAFTVDECVAVPSCDAAAPGALDCDDHVACKDDADGVRCEGCEDGFIDVGDGCLADDDCATFCGAGRACTFTTTNGLPDASCGDCASGFVLDAANNVCVDKVTCAELACDDADVCVDATPTSDAVCQTPTGCPFAQVDAGNGSCIDCVHCFDDDGAGAVAKDGVVGVGNGGLASGSKCVCELADGFFQSADDGSVKACDADDDGWVSADLLPVLRLNGGDNPFAREQKCTVRTVDRFELVADVPSTSGVQALDTRVVTVQSIVDRYGLSSATFERDRNGTAFVSLFEPERLDVPSEMALRYSSNDPRIKLRNYGGGAATASANDPSLFTNQLTASEANPLTKACNHDDDDLNEDSFKDVSQSQDDVDGSFAATVLEEAPLFYRMAYFLELDESFFRDRSDDCTSAGGTSPCHGAMVIKEKARQGELPVGYVDRSEPGFPSTYWQQCARSRDPDYQGAASGTLQINMDFAGWSTDCLSLTGACLTTTDLDGDGLGDTDPHVPYDGRVVRERAALADRPVDLTDANTPRWPGMNHHSQFKCVSLSASLPADESERARPSGSDLNVCTLSPRVVNASDGDDPQNPRDPQVSCIVGANTVADGFNAFAAVVPGVDVDSDYAGGCIVEGHEWNHLCAATENGLSAAVNNIDITYGQLFCACGATRSGERCEIGCADEQILVDAGANSASVDLKNGELTLTRTWTCAHPSLGETTLTDGTPTGITLIGEVPAQATPTETLSATNAAGTTLSVSAPPLR